MVISADRDTSRDPCPDRIIEDIGGAYAMGAMGGFIWHFGSGVVNTPLSRWRGGFTNAIRRAPNTGGAFAIWGGAFNAFDCTLQAIRRRDDHWNAIASGFLTGGVVAYRTGIASASQSAVIGGALLALIEGMSSVFSRYMQQTPREQALQALQQQKAMEHARITDGKSGEKSEGWMDWISGLGQGPAIPKSGYASDEHGSATKEAVHHFGTAPSSDHGHGSNSGSSDASPTLSAKHL